MQRIVIVVSVLSLFSLSAFGLGAGVGTNYPMLIYPSIQQCVDVAGTNGYKIWLTTNGSYYEYVIVSNKNLTFLGGYDDTLTNFVGGRSVINGNTNGTCIWFIDSSSRVDRVNLVSGSAIWGGGSLMHRSWVEFNECDIYSNFAWYGGGLFSDEYSYTKLIGASRVYTNVAWLFGGGAYVKKRMDVVDDEADFYNNTVLDGHGGAIWADYAYLRLFQADVFDNTAITGGIAPICVGGGIGAVNSFIEIGDGAYISGNTADYGGGIAVSTCTVYLGRARAQDCWISYNNAMLGGGLYATGSTIYLQGAQFEWNTATDDGGAAWIYDSSIESDTNVNLFNNNAAGASGGALYMDRATAILNTLLVGQTPGLGNSCGQSGGGIYATNSNIEIHGSHFAGNTATNPAPPYGWGGAIATIDGTTLITNGTGYLGFYTNNVFESNAASTNGGGGGLLISDTAGLTLIYDLVMYSNTAWNGGAIYLAPSSSCYLYKSRIDNNLALYLGGGIYGADMLLGVFSECSFFGNTAYRDGGAMYLGPDSWLFIDSGTFAGNVASNHGGAIACEGAEQISIYCRTDLVYTATGGWGLLFEGNQADAAGGIYISGSTNVNIYSAALISNVAPGYAGGIQFVDAEYELSQSLLAYASTAAELHSVRSTGNIYACTFYGILDGIRLYDSTCNISNTIIWSDAGAEILYETAASTARVEYSNIQGGFPGAGNIDADPRLYRNYHLRGGSPCINQGAPAAAGTIDIDGESRVISTCDIGFDEFKDSDGDTLPDIVETHTGIFVDETDTGTDPNDPETDGDNVNDNEEIVADTNPNNADSYLGFIKCFNLDGTNMLRYKGGQAADQYVEFVTEATNDNWSTLYSISAPTAITNEFSMDGISDTIFLRIRAERL